MPVDVDVTVPSRRDRVRAATTSEIIQTARRLLVTKGGAEVSLRAIAREMGMTAPAIYRYFDSHESLIRYLVADIFTELSDHLEAAVAAARSDGGVEVAGLITDVPNEAASTAAALIAACHAFRGWAVAHPAEFGLIFGSPLPGIDLYRDHPLEGDPAAECGTRFGLIFLRLVTELWRIKPFASPPDDEVSPSQRLQLSRYRDLVASDLPVGAIQTFLMCWVLLYGTVSLEVFGHLRFALEDSTGMFELVLADLASMLGMSYRPQD